MYSWIIVFSTSQLPVSGSYDPAAMDLELCGFKALDHAEPQAGADDAAVISGCPQRSPVELKAAPVWQNVSQLLLLVPFSTSLELLFRRWKCKEQPVPAAPGAGWPSWGSTFHTQWWREQWRGGRWGLNATVISPASGCPDCTSSTSSGWWASPLHEGRS